MQMHRSSSADTVISDRARVCLLNFFHEFGNVFKYYFMRIARLPRRESFDMTAAREPSTQDTLVAAVCAQPFDTEAWAKFVSLYGPHVVAWCRRYGLQEADARDVSQDVLMQFMRQAARFRHDRSKKFRGYLRTITHAAWCDWVEKGRRVDEVARGEGMERILAQTPARNDLVDSLEAQYDRELLGVAMEQVRGRVEPRTWEVFQLLAVEGLSGKEVVVRTGMKLGSAFAARHKVQRMLKDAVERLDT